MPLSSDLAEFVAGLSADAVPADVLERARSCLLNAYGIGLSSWMTPYAPVARAAALALAGERAEGATMLGDGRRTGEIGAILANGALFHGRAQEDTCGSAHFGVSIVPLLTALFEARRYPLDRFLPALIAGYEVGGLLEEACIAGTRRNGLRASPLYGTIAAAAAAAKAMDLPADRIAAALSNAASFTGGIAQALADGTDEWRYHAGTTAINGLLAAELAAQGSVSAPHAFEGPAGFVRAYAQASCDPAALTARLGRVWSLRRVAFKPHPVCAFNQTPVIAALALRGRTDPRAVRRGRIRMNPGETGYSGLDSHGPFASITGTLMSTPFCVATALLHGEPTMERMTDYGDREVMALTAVLDAVADPAVPPLSCVIELETADGRTLLEERMTGPDAYGYSWDELRQRLRRIGALSGVAPAAFDRIEAFAAGLPDADPADVAAAFAMPVGRR